MKKEAPKGTLGNLEAQEKGCQVGARGWGGNVTLCPRLGNWGLVNFFAYGYISGSGMRWN